MKTPYEIIKPDEGSSFRTLHQKAYSNTFAWHYHYHPEYELVFVVGGTGRRHVGSHLSYYEDGDLTFIGSNLPHSGFGFGALGEHEEIVIQFRDDFLGENFLEKPEMKAIKALFERSSFGITFGGNTKEQIGAEMIKLPHLSPFERLLHLVEILKILAESTDFELLNATKNRNDFNIKDQTRLKKIYEFVEQNYHQPIDMKAVADVANLTVPSFCNYFKKVINMTYTDFVNEYRINQACMLLLSDKSITDISFECGFTNVSYFSETFKKIKGKTPMQFRKSMNAEF